MTPLLALIRKDLQLFFSDRRSVIVSFVVPIAIASFFGSIFPGAKSSERARMGVALVDQDGSTISKALVAGAQGDGNLKITTPSADEARDLVRGGKLGVAVLVPKGFGEAAGKAFSGGSEKPTLEFLYDPSRQMELAMVRGVLTQHVMQAVSPGLTIPYAVHTEPLTSGSNVAYNPHAHSFAGMGIQFLLFAMANLGVEILLERQRGLWNRLRSAPISRLTLLAGKGASGTIVSLMILGVCFGFAMIVFGVRIEGSVLGFAAVCVACSMMAASFGLLVAALGNTPATARGITTLAVLMMVMLGGAWVPAFVFPAWLQQATKVVPVRWAVDGLDAMTWRGIGLSGAVAPTLVLLAFAAIFSAVAVLRFRWEEA